MDNGDNATPLDKMMNEIVVKSESKQTRDELCKIIQDLPHDAAVVLISDYFVDPETNEHYGFSFYTQNTSEFEARGLVDEALQFLRNS